MLKQLLMHGQARDVPLNRAPADMWSEVTSAVAGDGCMAPPRRMSLAFAGKYSGIYPQCLRLTRGSGAALGSVADEFFMIQTTGVSTGDPTLSLRLLDKAGTGIAPVTPAVWTAGGGCGVDLARQNAWTGGTFNGWEVFNAPGTIYAGTGNGLFPCAFDQTAFPRPAAAVVLPGWKTTPGEWRTYALRPFRDFLVAMQRWSGANFKYENTVFWSDAAGTGLPATWTPAAGNQAGDADLNDTPGPLIDGYVLGDDFIIFKPGSCIRMAYVGGSEVFQFSTLNSAAGIINRNCAVPYEGRLLVFGPNDIYALSRDGSTESLLTDGMRRYIYERIKPDHWDACSLQLSGAEGRLYAFYGNVPSTANSEYFTPDAAVLDLRTGRWGHVGLRGEAGTGLGFSSTATISRTPQATAATSSGLSSRVWLIGSGASTNNIYVLDCPEMDLIGEVGNLHPEGSSLIRRAIDLDAPQRSKTVTGLRLLMDAADGEYFSVTLTGRQLLDGASTETSGTMTWTAGTTQQLDCLVSGKFFDLTITNIYQINVPWKLYGVELDYNLAGSW